MEKNGNLRKTGIHFIGRIMGVTLLSLSVNVRNILTYEVIEL